MKSNIFNHKISWEATNASWHQRIAHPNPERAWSIAVAHRASLTSDQNSLVHQSVIPTPPRLTLLILILLAALAGSAKLPEFIHLECLSFPSLSCPGEPGHISVLSFAESVSPVALNLVLPSSFSVTPALFSWFRSVLEFQKNSLMWPFAKTTPLPCYMKNLGQARHNPSTHLHSGYCPLTVVSEANWWGLVVKSAYACPWFETNDRISLPDSLVTALQPQTQWPPSSANPKGLTPSSSTADFIIPPPRGIP